MRNGNSSWRSLTSNTTCKPSADKNAIGHLHVGWLLFTILRMIFHYRKNNMLGMNFQYQKKKTMKNRGSSKMQMYQLHVYPSMPFVLKQLDRLGTISKLYAWHSDWLCAISSISQQAKCQVGPADLQCRPILQPEHWHHSVHNSHAVESP